MPNYRIMITFDRSTRKDPWDIQSWYVYEGPREGLRDERRDRNGDIDQQSVDLHTLGWIDYRDGMLKRYRGES
jgi:hypothetical protein